MDTSYLSASQKYSKPIVAKIIYRATTLQKKNMKITKLAFLIVLTALHAVYAQEQEVPETSHTIEESYLELPRIKVVPIKDTKTDRTYELYIKLPEAYLENKDKAYPVIYYTDALWHVEMLSGATEYLMEEVILVGISWQKDIREDLKKAAGAHVSRFRDYSVRESSNTEHQTKYQFGQADNHLDFIRNDVIPYVEKTYRSDPGNRTYFGYSLGGVFGAYTLLKQPETFANYILGSPALQGDIPILSEMESDATLKSKGFHANVFISYGELEQELSEHANKFIELLKENHNDELSLHHEVIAGTHQTAFPMTVLKSINWLLDLNDSIELENQYVGQKPPGLVPEPFAPDRVTTAGWEYGGVFSPNQKEFYFIRENAENEQQEFVVLAYKNQQWITSVISPRVGQPFISPNGQTMHLGKKYKERSATGWSEVKRLGSPFEEIQIMRLTASSKGTYVFDEIGMPDGDGVIRYSQLVDGKREAPKPFGKTINTGKMNAHPFIAPDESYLIFDGEREGGYGDSDLYISFRQEDGTWGNAINLGDTINTEAWEAAATVTPDGKYLFFNRNIGSAGYENVDVFWVDFISLKKELVENSN